MSSEYMNSYGRCPVWRNGASGRRLREALVPGRVPVRLCPDEPLGYESTYRPYETASVTR